MVHRYISSNQRFTFFLIRRYQSIVAIAPHTKPALALYILIATFLVATVYYSHFKLSDHEASSLKNGDGHNWGLPYGAFHCLGDGYQSTGYRRGFRFHIYHLPQTLYDPVLAGNPPNLNDSLAESNA